MIFGRLYTIIFHARIQEIHSLRLDVKRLVGRRQGSRDSRGQGLKGEGLYGVMEYRSIASKQKELLINRRTGAEKFFTLLQYSITP